MCQATLICQVTLIAQVTLVYHFRFSALAPSIQDGNHIRNR
jgi:hypothetical protein